MHNTSRQGTLELLPEFEVMLDESQGYPYNGANYGYKVREFEGGPVPVREVPKTISRFNTDLNAPYFGGNFSFLYNGGSNEATITFNTYLSFRRKFSDPLKDTFKDNLRKAVDVWDSAAELQVRDTNGNFNDRIKLRFKLAFVKDPRNANKRTDVHPNGTRATWFMDKGRENVMRELNVFIGSSRNVLVHELGHVWGLLDEYKDRWISMKLSLGHVGSGSPLLNDKISIMNEGYINNSGEFRTRFFSHFGRAILNSFMGLKNYTVPLKHNGKVISRIVRGRIALLKRDIAGNTPYPNSVLPYNPQFTNLQVAKR
jgi:hypothetical protein